MRWRLGQGPRSEGRAAPSAQELEGAERMRLIIKVNLAGPTVLTLS